MNGSPDRIGRPRRPAPLRRGRPDRRAGERMRHLLAILGVAVAVLVPATPAAAHNALAEAKPAKNATLTKAPAEVSLRFLQKLNPKLTTIVVSDQDKQRVPAAAPEIDGATGSVTFDGVLANGGYTVAYQVVSVDGHTVKGSYRFTVADPAAPAPAAETSPTPSAAPQSALPVSTPAAAAGPAERHASPWPVVAGVALAAAAAAVVVLVLRRRRRPGPPAG